MLAVLVRGCQRVAVTALSTIPLVLAIVSMMPVLLVSVFLREDRRQPLLDLVGQIIRWVEVIALASPPPKGPVAASPPAAQIKRITQSDALASGPTVID